MTDNKESNDPRSLQVENVSNHVQDNELAYKGDNSDGKITWTFRRVIAVISLASLYAASQIVLCFIGGCLSYVEKDLNATSTGSWLTVSNTLAIAAVAPFVGYMEDFFGRRNITLIGSVVIMVGLVVVGTAHSFGAGVAGMALCGAGNAVCELTALAGVSDIVPVRQRGKSLALVTGSILPFTPYMLYAQVLASRANWRWTIWITLIYNGLIFLGLVTCYFPKEHPRIKGLLQREALSQIDYIGAVLSIVGITLFLVALQGGGYTRPWKSAYVLAQLLIGIAIISSWIFWEWKWAKRPMIPRELFSGQRVVGLTFFVAFVGGVNFYSILNFFPITFSALYNPEPIQIGLKGVGFGIATTVGAVFFNSLLSVPTLHCRYVITSGAVLMTAFGCALIASNPDNPKLTVALGTVAGFGIGAVLVPAATLALIVVPDSLLATTAALVISIRTIGGSIGYTIYYNIFVNKLDVFLPESVTKYALDAGLPLAHVESFVTTFLTTPEEITNATGYTPAIAEAATIGSRWAYANALRYVWYTSIPFGCLAIVSAIFLPDIKQYQTNRIAVSL